MFEFIRRLFDMFGYKPNMREELEHTKKELSDIKEKIQFLEKISEKNEELEKKVIQYEQTKNLVLYSDIEEDMKKGLDNFVEKLNIKHPENVQNIVMAKEVIDKYDIKKYSPPSEYYPSRVISIEEFRNNPEKYFPKMEKSFFEFPIEVDLTKVTLMLRKMYGHFDISNDAFSFGYFVLTHNDLNVNEHELMRYDHDNYKKTFNLLKQINELTNIGSHFGDSILEYNQLDFLVNSEKIEQIILNTEQMLPKVKKNMIGLMRIAKEVIISGLEIAGRAEIQYSEDILKAEEDNYVHKRETFREKIQEMLLSDIKYTTREEINRLLPIRNLENFIALAHERTQEILERDKKYRGLTSSIKKDIKDYSVGETIALASYFARNIIEEYEDLDQAVDKALKGIRDEKMKGKCTDYTGLALHYLNEYLIPLNPEKFKNWRFGYDSTVIGDYKHCYIKAMHFRESGKIEVYFLDPTQLANEGIKGLKTPENVAKMMDTRNHPLLINRDAEDLLYKKIDPKMDPDK